MKPEVSERIRAEMRPLIDGWRASGETRRAFASRHGISVPKFDYWARQLAPVRPRAPRRAALLYSLVQSCKLIDVSPFAYLKDVLLRVATHPHRLIHS